MIMCMSTQQERREIFLAFKCMTCIRESYMACPFLTLSISKLEIEFTQSHEICWVSTTILLHRKYNMRVWYQFHAEYAVSFMLDTPGKIIKGVISYPVYLHPLTNLLHSEKELCRVVRCSIEVRVREWMGKVVTVPVAGPGLPLG